MHLTKSKTPTHVGPIQVTLTKTDPKKFKYTLMVVADDKTIEKKDKTADEPVQFYIKGATRPYEIVVFDVTKDKVNGYLSTPKDIGQRARPVARTAGLPSRVCDRHMSVSTRALTRTAQARVPVARLEFSNYLLRLEAS